MSLSHLDLCQEVTFQQFGAYKKAELSRYQLVLVLTSSAFQVAGDVQSPLDA